MEYNILSPKQNTLFFVPQRHKKEALPHVATLGQKYVATLNVAMENKTL
jgi:hypothetical protein